MSWGDPGVTERQLIQETSITMPGQGGGRATGVLQRAGFLERLRLQTQAEYAQTAASVAPARSVKGSLGSLVNRITLRASGLLPLYDATGLMTQVYNEVQNRDGSVLAPPAFVASPNGAGLSSAASLLQYDAPGTGVQTYTMKYPFEIQMAVPLWVNGQKVEWGLWLLQNQTVDLALEINYNALASTTAGPDFLYSGGTGLTGSATLANCKTDVERSLYTVPASEKDYPDIGWVHQMVEYTQPFTGNYSRFDIPKAGILLRAVVYTEDTLANGAVPIESTDISQISWIYGANASPIVRPGKFVTQEFLQDYGRYAPKGAVVLDFYKWGGDALKLVKDTQALANLRIETNFSATAAGTQRILLDRMVPVARLMS